MGTVSRPIEKNIYSVLKREQLIRELGSQQNTDIHYRHPSSLGEDKARGQCTVHVLPRKLFL